MMSPWQFIKLTWLLAAIILLYPVMTSAVGVNFNFQPESATVIAGGVNPAGSFVAGNDGSRFYQDLVLIDGVSYYHVVVGDPNTGFVIESYVTGTTPLNMGPGNATFSPIRPSSLDSGGNERVVIGNFPTDATSMNAIPGTLIGNALDPFGVTVSPASIYKPYDLSGNGTADPNRTMFRMIVSDAQMEQEVFKPILERKPRVSQTTTDTDMLSQFIADMRGLSYSSKNIAAPVFNRLSMTPGDLPVLGAADFDMSMSQRSNVTAGRYTYTPGAGWNNSVGWDSAGSQFDEGTYSYADGAGFNLEGIRWEKFFDATQNLVYCTPPSQGVLINRTFSPVTCPQP